MKTRIAILVIVLALLLVISAAWADSAAWAQSGGLASYTIEASTASGGGYQLSSETWQVSGAASGEG